MKYLLKSLIVMAGFAVLSGAALAADRPPSTCLAVAENIRSPELPNVHFASVTLGASLDKYEVAISYQGHSTYLIESAGGERVATDYAGWMADPRLPTIVTMNQAHSSHFTSFPDPKIPNVLRGWNPEGGPADHQVEIGDVLVRNVTTDILRFNLIPDGNSIFIFEVAGLCIGHLGHLHHKLSESQYAKIGRLDVVMVPVDGGLTLAHSSVNELLERMRSSVVLPMHVRFSGALPGFLSYLGDRFAVKTLRQNRLVLSLKTLPKQPTVILLPGVSSFPQYDE